MLPLLLPLLWAGSLAQDGRYRLTMQESVTVQEGLCVSVPCAFSIPERAWTNGSSVHGYWFREWRKVFWNAPVATSDPSLPVQEEAQGRFRLLGKPEASNCSLDIRDAQRNDTGSYFFRVLRGPSVEYTYEKNPLTLRVTALTLTPHIFIPGTLEPGRPSEVTCSVPWACQRGTPPIFSWTSDALFSLDPRTRRSSVLTLTPRPQDHGANLTCQVMFPAAGVTVEGTVQLNVTWTSGPRVEVVLVASVVAVVKTLFLLLCLIVLTVKYQRRKATRSTVCTDEADAIPEQFDEPISSPQDPRLTTPLATPAPPPTAAAL